MSETQYLTRDEAALACGVSKDTLRKDQRDGKLPHCRARADGRTEIAVADLVAAGRLDPLASDAPLTEIVTKSRTERELLEARHHNALLEAELVSRREELRHRDEEIRFLRGLLRGKQVA